jgi:hypothetical protein
MFGSYLGVKNISVSKAANRNWRTPKCKDNAAGDGMGKTFGFVGELRGKRL